MHNRVVISAVVRVVKVHRMDSDVPPVMEMVVLQKAGFFTLQVFQRAGLVVPKFSLSSCP